MLTYLLLGFLAFAAIGWAQRKKLLKLPTWRLGAAAGAIAVYAAALFCGLRNLWVPALVLGVMPNLTFEGEQLVLGGPTAAPYRTLTVAVGRLHSPNTFSRLQSRSPDAVFASVGCCASPRYNRYGFLS